MRVPAQAAVLRYSRTMKLQVVIPEELLSNLYEAVEGCLSVEIGEVPVTQATR